MKALREMAEGGRYAPRMGTKKQAFQYFKTKINHKKLPTFKKEIKESPKQKEYKNLSVEEYEKKYEI